MHDITVAPTDFFVKNISTWENLFYCYDDTADRHLLFRFFESQPASGCTETSSWKTVNSLREEASSPEWVDEFLFRSMNMMTSTPDSN